MYTDNKTRLDDAFKALRKLGLVARQNFGCCGGCAAGELGDLAKEKGKKGAVYYHRQDTERLLAHEKSGRRYAWARRQPCEELYLGFGAVGSDDRSGDLEVGGLVLGALLAAGLQYTWDGRPETRILVHLPGGIHGGVVQN